jgi:hypothetical protein
MILRRSVILAFASIPLLVHGAFSQTAVKARRVGLLSSSAPLLGLLLGFPSAAMLSDALWLTSGEQLKHTRNSCRGSWTS